MVLLKGINITEVEIVNIVFQPRSKGQVMTATDNGSLCVISGAQRQKLIVPIFGTDRKHKRFSRIGVPGRNKGFGQVIGNAGNRIALDQQFRNVESYDQIVVFIFDNFIGSTGTQNGRQRIRLRDVYIFYLRADISKIESNGKTIGKLFDVSCIGPPHSTDIEADRSADTLLLFIANGNRGKRRLNVADITSETPV